MKMETFEAVRTMLAVRRYQDKALSPELVKRIVEAGHLSASSMNLQPWRFIVVQDRETLKTLGGLARTGPYAAEARLAIAVAIEKKSKFAVSDASRAIQSMMLTAWSEGVGSNWIGFSGLDAIHDLLGIPAELDLLALVSFGYPVEAVGRGKKNRKPLGEIAFRERYGQPFA
ncbi:MAG TPA: nitroreductase family protein [Chloroflexota bacterium]|nr:nitroreductase family protein [Chloroflexota bacterium]